MNKKKQALYFTFWPVGRIPVRALAHSYVTDASRNNDGQDRSAEGVEGQELNVYSAQ
jgi:hypothetical protein